MIAVLHEYFKINGAVYDALEYAHELNKHADTKLIFIKHVGNHLTSDMIIDYAIQKYNSKPDFEIGVQQVGKIDTTKYSSMLFIDAEAVSKIPLYRFNTAYVLADYVPRAMKNYEIVSKIPNIYLYNEMPFFPSEVNYTMKFAFDWFKSYDMFDDSVLHSFKYANDHIMILEDNQSKEQKSIKFPVNDFHKRFNTYEYFNRGYFDPRPRLFHECSWYNKTIKYDDSGIVDGSTYRYNDIVSGNDITLRGLNKNDVIIQRMLND